MTRARDFADVISGNFDLPSGALDNASGEPVFQKTTVASTGAVSLDLSGDNNFFDASTLTADTTVSFTNAPSKKKFTYSFIPGHDSSASSVNDTDTWKNDFTIRHTTGFNSYGATFNSDGTKGVYLDGQGDYLTEVDLAVPYDDSSAVRARMNVYSLSTSTATFVNAGSFGGNNTGPRNVRFSADGTKLLVLNTSADNMWQYNLNTAYDLSTYSSYNTYSVSTYESSPQAWCFNSDGTRFFISGASGDDINQYNLSTAYDITTASAISTGISGSAYLSQNGLDSMMMGKNNEQLFGFHAQSASGALVSFAVTEDSSGTHYDLSVRTQKYMAAGSFGILGGNTVGMNYINLDRIRVERGFDNVGGGIIECGTSYWPAFSGTISGQLGHFSRGYRHFIDFETSNTGTSYGIIGHRKIYVG